MQNDLRRITIRAVAEAAGVSVTTVSFALSDQGRHVNPETRARVRAVADQLGYRPNPSAQRLRGKSLGQIAIVLQEGDDDLLVNAYFGRLLLACMVEANAHHLFSLVIVRRHGEDEKFLRAVKEGRADGYILCAPRRNDTILDRLAELDAPIVTIAGPRGLPFPRIGLANSGAITEIVDALRSLGHQRFLQITGDLHQEDAMERAAAFRAAVPEGEVLEGSFGEHNERLPAVFARSLSLLQRSFAATAVLAPNDSVALGLLAAAQAKRLQCPRDFSLIGFDDTPIASARQLATYRQPVPEMGRLAVGHLLALMQGETPSNLDIPGTLVLRDSVSRAPGTR